MADLKQYFPMIQDRKEVLAKIHDKVELLKLFYSWTEEQQEEFLDFCTGVRGPRMLYDAFFKEVMNPESAPERLNEFLSLILGTPVKIYAILPNDSTRLADESSLLITDIVVELKDGSLANVEEAERLRADRLEESERQKSEQLEQALRRIAELEEQKG